MKPNTILMRTRIPHIILITTSRCRTTICSRTPCTTTLRTGTIRPRTLTRTIRQWLRRRRRPRRTGTRTTTPEWGRTRRRRTVEVDRPTTRTTTRTRPTCHPGAAVAQDRRRTIVRRPRQPDQEALPRTR